MYQRGPICLKSFDLLRLKHARWQNRDCCDSNILNGQVSLVENDIAQKAQRHSSEFYQVNVFDSVHVECGPWIYLLYLSLTWKVRAMRRAAVVSAIGIVALLVLLMILVLMIVELFIEDSGALWWKEDPGSKESLFKSMMSMSLSCEIYVLSFTHCR